MKDYSAELAQSITLLSDLVAHAQAFDISRLAFTPAVIDNSTTSTTVWRSEETTGMKKFIESVIHHLGIFESVSRPGGREEGTDASPAEHLSLLFRPHTSPSLTSRWPHRQNRQATTRSQSRSALRLPGKQLCSRPVLCQLCA